MSRKKGSNGHHFKQTKARKKKFANDQYWHLAYTEVYKNSDERDFKTIIKARSSDLAKSILIARLKEDENFIKVRSLTISMIHGRWQIASLNKPLSVMQWEAIRAVSFPNDWNKLFKFEKKRIEGQVNRFNKLPTPLTEERRRVQRKQIINLSKVYNKNSFKPLCPELKEECNSKKYLKENKIIKGHASFNNPRHKKMELDYIKKLMSECGGNITYASEKAGVSRSVMKRTLNKFSEVDWKKDFPLTFKRKQDYSFTQSSEYKAKMAEIIKNRDWRPTPNKKGTKQYKKWKQTITPTLEAKTQKLFKEHKENMMKFMRETNCDRKKSAELMGISHGYFTNLLYRFKKEDEAFAEEFCSKEICSRSRSEANKKRHMENRLKFLRENKHLILQAYYQNGESDYKAAKALNIEFNTFRRWRARLDEYKV